MRISRHAVLLTAILLIALVARLAAGAWWRSRLPEGERFGFGDSDSYWTLAEAIAHGRTYAYGHPGMQVFRTPGYPLILSSVFCLPPEFQVTGAFVLSAILGTVTVAAVYGVARIIFGRESALVAAMLAALYPGAIAQGALVLSEAAFCPLMLAQMYCWVAVTKMNLGANRRGVLLAVGALGGAASLVRPSWLLFTPLALAVWLFMTLRGWIGVGVARGVDPALILLGLIVVMTPWWVRNAVVTGHFVPTTLQVGASLYDGLNPKADGSSNMDFVRDFIAADTREVSEAWLHSKTPPKDEIESRLNSKMRYAALVWAIDNPLTVIKLAAIKFTRTWNIWPNEPGLRSWPLRLVVAVTYVPMLILGLIGAVWFTRRPKAMSLSQVAPDSRPPTPDSRFVPILLWLPAVYFSLLHMIFVGSIRYREPAMLCLIVLAAGTINVIYQKRTESPKPA